MPHDVFISYVNADRIIADAVCAKLEQAKILCWIAPRDVILGENWAAAIDNAIHGCLVAVFIFSANSNGNPHVDREALLALNQCKAGKCKAIIPFRIEDVAPVAALAFVFSSTHWLDAMAPPLEDRVDELVAGIVSLINPSEHESETAIFARPEQKPREPGQATTASKPDLPKPTPWYSRGRFIGLAVLLLLIVASAGYAWYRRSGFSVHHDKRWYALIGALPWERWVVYDPTGYDPYHGQFPAEMSMRDDLRALQSKGFNGLITMSSGGPLKDIARIAHETGFQMVIVGVWDVRNTNEVSAALSVAEYADAYCIGQSGLSKRYSVGELREMVARFQRETARPVVVSETLGEYESNPQLVLLGDFLFPDVHSNWRQGETPEDAWAETFAAARKAAQLVSGDPERQVLLKMVSFPSGGAPGLTPITQARFYRYVVEGARDNKDIPARVSFSFMGAFDTPWKATAYGWTPPEQSTGLFTVKREPKLAVSNVKWAASR